MRPTPSKLPPRRTGPGFRQREQRRTLIKATILVGLFSLILGILYMAAVSISEPVNISRMPPASPPQDSLAKHRIGSIVLVPWSGSQCTERSFDNLTGRIVSENVVDCETKLSPEDANLDTNPSSTLSRDERMRAITNAFKK